MRTVSQLLLLKGSQVWATTPESSVYDALQVMAEKNVGALLVFEAKALVGIFSERDYARKVALRGKTSMDTPVGEIMTTRVYWVRPDQTLDDCMALMTDKRIRHLPVMENERVVGVISIGDVVKVIISEQEFIIEQLENYIQGSR
jgi:CBS domain-containing protein